MQNAEGSHDPVASNTNDLASEMPTLLVVDDEQGILSAISRTLRKSGYRLFTATSGIAALELMTREAVDVVVSDMRMPRMDGAELLARVKKNWPQASRVLITGQSDLNEAVRAVNRGGIHYYIGKPWDDDDLCRVVDEAVQRATLLKENQRLLALTQSQNTRLAALNAELESRVRERTADLERTLAKLEKRNRSLNDSYRSTIRLLSNLIEMRPGIQKGFARQVADLSGRVARVGELNRRTVLDVHFASLLHELGKVGLPEDMLVDYEQLTAEQREIYHRYPVFGQLALEATEFLRGCGAIIAAHCENWDGRGFPNLLSATRIPIGARVLRVSRDYILELQTLARIAPKHRSRHAFEKLQQHIGSRYDADVMHWLEIVLDRERRESAMEDESCVVVRQLMPGMVLSRDVVTSHGVVMLARDHVLTERNIDSLAELQVVERREISVWVFA